MERLSQFAAVPIYYWIQGGTLLPIIDGHVMV
jgi:hypothetical protein